MLHPPKCHAFDRDGVGVGLGDEITDGACKQGRRAEMNITEIGIVA